MFPTQIISQKQINVKREGNMVKEINQKILFLGNGIYRAFHGEIESWNSILNTLFRELRKGKLREMPDCSPILKYEYLHTQVEKDFDSKVANCLKRMYKRPQFLKHCDKINEMVWGHFDTVITTNVDNRLEAIEKNGNRVLKRNGNSQHFVKKPQLTKIEI